MTSSIRTDMGVALLTKEGGVAFPSINGLGSLSVQGTLVIQSASADETFQICPADGESCIGVVYNVVSNAEVGWIVHSGRTPVLLETGTGCFSGESIGISPLEAGRAAAGTDYKVIGIATETIPTPGVGESSTVLAILSIGREGSSSILPNNFWSYFPAGFY